MQINSDLSLQVTNGRVSMERDALVICTRNRALDMSQCLNSLNSVTALPARIIVVDSSVDDSTKIVVDNWANRNRIVGVSYLQTEPGLTFQRNQGLKAVHGDVEVVHFIDDDTRPVGSYFSDLSETIRSSAQIGGVCGAVLGVESGTPNLLSRVTLCNSRRRGALLKSGHNVGCYSHSESGPVDWLPGCSMSYRASMIDGLFFDERRSGYSMGEDVDFSARVGMHSELRYVASAQIHHLESSVNRHSPQMLSEMGVLHRWQLATDGVAGVRRDLVAFSAIATASTLLARGIKSRDRVLISRARGTIIGLKRAMGKN